MSYKEEELAVEGHERDLLDHVVSVREQVLAAAAAELLSVGQGGGVRREAEREQRTALHGGSERAHARVHEHCGREAEIAAVEMQSHLRQAVDLQVTIYSTINSRCEYKHLQGTEINVCLFRNVLISSGPAIQEIFNKKCIT